MPPLVIGHAAAAGEAPANTLAGVRAALDAGADAIEIDVQLSADGVPVLMHDITVDRTTNLRGRVRDLTFAQLQGADAGNGEPVPSLEQVLGLVAGRFAVMCELKSTPGDPKQDAMLVERVLEVLRGCDARRWTAIHSFSPNIVAAARFADPGVPAALISPAVRGDALGRVLGAAIKRNAQAISLNHQCIDRDVVLLAKRRQLSVWAWTADRREDWQRLVDAGVAGIITNVPHRLRAFLG